LKPAPFKYVKPVTTEQVLELLAEHGDDACILAGGQSLIPALALRLRAPTMLIDINSLSDLDRRPELGGNFLRLSALTRHASLVKPEISQRLPLLGVASPWIAHAGIRHRGTLGGSLSVGDPASELPACAVVLDAMVILKSKARGERQIKASEFYFGVFDNAREPDELITACDFPVHASSRVVFREIARRKGDYATAACVAVLGPAPESSLRIVFFGISDRPILALNVARAIKVASSAQDAISSATAAFDVEVQPQGDVWHSAAVKTHICKTLLKEVVHELRAGR